MVNVTKREKEFLECIYTHFRQHRVWPDTNDLKKLLGVEKSRISDIKRSLKNKGLLEGASTSPVLSELGAKYLERQLAQELASKPLYLPLIGEVKAGATNLDELIAYLSEFSSIDDAPTVPIPHKTTVDGAFLMKVIGQSMEQEGIYENDYLIVERIQADAIQDGDMIVTYYLPWSFSELLNASDFMVDDLSHEFIGPVVKFCSRLENRISPSKGLHSYYRLGWRKNADRSEYTIKALDVRPVGRVVGIYRQINRTK